MLMIVEHGYNMPGEVPTDVYTRGPRKKKQIKKWRILFANYMLPSLRNLGVTIFSSLNY